MNKIIGFVKREAVLCIAFVLALASTLIVPPNAGYIDYVEWSTLGLLFCLMAVVKGFDRLGAFSSLSGKLTAGFHNTRTLGAALSLMCFFLAMVVTNDVALITLVPLTITLFQGKEEVTIRTIVLETAAANLGSMATPVGNPQNLFIYTHYNMPIGEFFQIMLPLTLVSLVLVVASAFFIPSSDLNGTSRNSKIVSDGRKKLRIIAMVIAAAFCLCTVLRLTDWKICLAAVLICVAVADAGILKQMDYALLLTFICFFVFVGNISAVSELRQFISEIVSGREMLMGAVLSQVISNVPCAVMLSGFTENAGQLLLGVDIGGMGTLIASLASLISFKLYGASEGAKKGRYFAEFTVYNFSMLAVLFAAQLGINVLFG